MEPPSDEGGCVGNERSPPQSAQCRVQSRFRGKGLGAKPGSITIQGVTRSRSFSPGACGRLPPNPLSGHGPDDPSDCRSKSHRRLFSECKVLEQISRERFYGETTLRKDFDAVPPHRRNVSEILKRNQNKNLSSNESHNASKNKKEYSNEKRYHHLLNNNDIPTSSQTDAQENETSNVSADHEAPNDTHQRSIPRINTELTDKRSNSLDTRDSFNISVHEISADDISLKTENLPCIMKRHTQEGLSSSLEQNNNRSMNAQSEKVDRYNSSAADTSSSTVLENSFGLYTTSNNILPKTERDSLKIRKNILPKTTAENITISSEFGELNSFNSKYYVKHDLQSPLRLQLEAKTSAEKNVVYNPYYTFLPEFSTSSISFIGSKNEKSQTNSEREYCIHKMSLSSRIDHIFRNRIRSTPPNTKYFQKNSTKGIDCLQTIYPTCLAMCINHHKIRKVMGNECSPHMFREVPHLRQAKQENDKLKTGDEHSAEFLEPSPQSISPNLCSSLLFHCHNRDEIHLADIITKNSKIPSHFSNKTHEGKNENNTDNSCRGAACESNSRTYCHAQRGEEEKENVKITQEIYLRKTQSKHMASGDSNHPLSDDNHLAQENVHTTQTSITNNILSHVKDINRENRISPVLKTQNLRNFPFEGQSNTITNSINYEHLDEYLLEKTPSKDQNFYSTLLSSSFNVSIGSCQYIGCPSCTGSIVLDDEMERKFNDQVEKYNSRMSTQLPAEKSIKSVKSQTNSNEFRSPLDNVLVCSKRKITENVSLQDSQVKLHEDRNMHSRHGKYEMTNAACTISEDKISTTELRNPSTSVQRSKSKTPLLLQPSLPRLASIEENPVKSCRSPNCTAASQNPRNGKSPKSHSTVLQKKLPSDKCKFSYSWSPSTEPSNIYLEKEEPLDYGKELNRKDNKIYKNKNKIAILRPFSGDVFSGEVKEDNTPLVLVTWDQSSNVDSKSLKDDNRSYSLLYWNKSSEESKCTKHVFANLLRRLISAISSSVLQIKESSSSVYLMCHSTPQNSTTSTNFSTPSGSKQSSLNKIDIPTFNSNVFCQSQTADTKFSVLQNQISGESQAQLFETQHRKTNYNTKCESRESIMENLLFSQSFNENGQSTSCQEEEESIKNKTSLEIYHPALCGNEQGAKDLLFFSQDNLKENDEIYSSLKRDILERKSASFKSITSNNSDTIQKQFNGHNHILETTISSIPCYFKQMPHTSPSKERKFNENGQSTSCQEEESIKNKTSLEIYHPALCGNEQGAKDLLVFSQDNLKENDEIYSSLKRDILEKKSASFKSITSNNSDTTQNQFNEYNHILETTISSIPCYFKQMPHTSPSKEWNMNIDYPSLSNKKSEFSWWRQKQKSDTYNKLFGTLGVFYLTSDRENSSDEEFDAISWHD